MENNMPTKAWITIKIRVKEPDFLLNKYNNRNEQLYEVYCFTNVERAEKVYDSVLNHMDHCKESKK